jgi:methyltransferase (TIGR00027 family)
LFDDPWAEAFIAAVTGGHTSVTSELPRVGPARDDGSSALWTLFSACFSGRTPFYDEQVQLGVEAGARQIVLLAAGLDARAVRLGLPAGTKVFEVDTREVLEFKEAVLDRERIPTGERVPVAADLREDWASALIAAGFRAGEATVWLAEGVLVYLDAAECDRLLATITKLSGPGSRFATECFTRNPRADDVESPDPGDRAAGEMMISLFNSGPPSRPETWLPAHGWSPYVSDLAAELRRQERPVPELYDPHTPDHVGLWLTGGTC